MSARCYYCDKGEARYIASIDHDCTPTVLLCTNCAAEERALSSVNKIASLPR